MCDRSEVEDLGMDCIQHYPLSLSCLSQLKCQNVLAIPSFEGQTSNQTPRPYKSKPPNSRSSTKIPGCNRGKWQLIRIRESMILKMLQKCGGHHCILGGGPYPMQCRKTLVDSAPRFTLGLRMKSWPVDPGYLLFFWGVILPKIITQLYKEYNNAMK